MGVANVDHKVHHIATCSEAENDEECIKMTEEEASYIDYETFLDPSFSAASFANSLVLSMNNPQDTQLDLSTPLSRVLFDVQEIDTHIDSLTTKSALPLLTYTKDRADASDRILSEVESQVASLTEEYKILEKEVIQRHEAASQVQLAAERLCETIRLGRTVGRCLLLGRQLEVQMSEFQGSASAGKKGDHRAMVRAASTVVSLREIMGSSKADSGLERVDAITTLQANLVTPSERTVLSRAQQVVKEFSMSSLLASTAANQSSTADSITNYSQTEDTKSRATSALLTLYILSPVSFPFQPDLLIKALQDYLQTALKSSLASLTRSLATLPTLDRTLVEISARCQNIVALEALLESIKPPPHPLLSRVSRSPSDGTSDAPPGIPNFLSPLLHSLDTASLPSYFWRTLASALSPRVQEILNRGGVSARTLRSNKDGVREKLRGCVDRGSRLPEGLGLGRGKEVVGGWEREAAVMVGAVVGVLGR